MLDQNFQADTHQHRTAQQGGPLLEELAQAAAQEAPHHGQQEGHHANDGGGQEDVDLHKGHGDPYGQGVDAGSQGQEE